MQIRTVFRNALLKTAFKYQRQKQMELKVTLVRIAVNSEMSVKKGPHTIN
jgi:hypothetical protein